MAAAGPALLRPEDDPPRVGQVRRTRLCLTRFLEHDAPLDRPTTVIVADKFEEGRAKRPKLIVRPIVKSAGDKPILYIHQQDAFHEQGRKLRLVGAYREADREAEDDLGIQRIGPLGRRRLRPMSRQAPPEVGHPIVIVWHFSHQFGRDDTGQLLDGSRQFERLNQVGRVRGIFLGQNQGIGEGEHRGTAGKARIALETKFPKEMQQVGDDLVRQNGRLGLLSGERSKAIVFHGTDSCSCGCASRQKLSSWA